MSFRLAYAAAWLPLLAAYLILFIVGRGLSVPRALVSALITVLPGALLGLAVWWRVRTDAGGRSLVWSGFSWHVLHATAYSVVWSGVVAALIALTASSGALDSFIRTGLAWQLVFGVAAYAVIAGSAAKGVAEERARSQELAANRAEAARLAAELRSLRARLDPHFLFNTLHSITALVRSDAQATELALERFAAMLRYVLDADRQARDQVTLEEELAFVRDYLELERLRLGDRLCICEHVEAEALECLLPPLTIQPLVENAVQHGLAPLARGGTLTLRAFVSDEGSLRVEVRDDGTGAAAGTVRVTSSGGLGLSIVRERLLGWYPGAARLDVETAPGRGFTVRFEIPAVV